MRYLLGVVRITIVFLIIVLGVTLLAVLYPFAGHRHSNGIFVVAKRALLWVVGVRVHGKNFDHIGPGLVMANHRSYLDVLFVPTLKPARIVAKIEVRSWPLIGWAARALGTIWVKRENKNSRMAAREAIIQAVQDGNTVIVFPEGTSWEGPQMLPLKPAMFYEAAQHGFKIYQWSLHFDSAKTAFPIGINFVGHLWAIVTEWRINAYIDVREAPIESMDGDALLEDAQSWWFQSLKQLSDAHPAKHSGYWPDDRLKLPVAQGSRA